MRIVICGSMAFSEEMLEVGSELKDMGHEVFLPKNAKKYANEGVDEEFSGLVEEKVDHDLIKTFFEEIGESDAVLVVNPEKKGIPNYIGGNSFLEMAFAHVQDKEIYLLHDIPDMSYTDEIVAMDPTCLNGSLEELA